MPEKEYNTAAEITPEVIANWKISNPRGIWELKVVDQETKEGTTYKTGYVRKPTREEMKFAMTLATKNDPLGMVEEILKSCWMGGDIELLNDDDFFYGAAMQLQELVEVKAGELKKL